MASRDEIRRQMRQRRRSLPATAKRAAAHALARRVTCSTLLQRHQHIAFYLANDGEMDLMPLIRRAWAMGKHCYLPVLSPAFHNRLWFARFTPDTPLAPNQFRIAEPVARWCDMRPAWTLDLVLTPLVAFDLDGNRLGMGGGFYDRTLAYLARRSRWRKPHLVGVAYEFQRAPALPHAPWDVPLHGVITEGAVYELNRR